MEPVTLESLAKRVESLESQVRRLATPKDWRSVVGTMDDSEIVREVNAAIAAERERDRQEFFEQYDREMREAADRGEGASSD